MKDSYLTLRLPRDLARALALWARNRGVAKSAMVREAVAQYLSPPPPAPDDAARVVTARELAARWGTLPRLAPGDAAGLERDLTASREALPLPKPQWD